LPLRYRNHLIIEKATFNASTDSWTLRAGKKNVGTNKSFLHPRLSTINNLMTFAGAHNNPRYVDVYDSARKVWAKKSIWGNLFVTGKDGQVVLSSNGSEIRKH
jgi:hypothetical protein